VGGWREEKGRGKGERRRKGVRAIRVYFHGEALFGVIQEDVFEVAEGDAERFDARIGELDVVRSGLAEQDET
jgi:hypothetical protein